MLHRGIQMGYGAFGYDNRVFGYYESTIRGKYPDAENMHPDGIFWHPDTPKGIRMLRVRSANSKNSRERNDGFFFLCINA